MNLSGKSLKEAKMDFRCVYCKKNVDIRVAVAAHKPCFGYEFNRAHRLREALRNLLESINNVSGGKDPFWVQPLHTHIAAARAVLDPPTVKQQLVEALEAVLLDLTQHQQHEITPFGVSLSTKHQIDAALAAAKKEES